MVMIIFNLIVFFNVKDPLFFLFFKHFLSFFWVLVINLFFIILYFFCLFLEGDLGYIFGCDLTSYDLILLSL
jgi:hypothetical protein